jgi:hypothetical protein
MDGIADLLDSPEGHYPVPAPSREVVAPVRPSPPQPKRSRSPLIAATAIGFLAVAFLVGRATAPDHAVQVQVPVPISPVTAWMPDCTTTPGDPCQVETVLRRFIAAWQTGGPIDQFIGKGAQIPQRVPRGPITRTPQVSVTGQTAVALWWTDSDGMFSTVLDRYSGEWRVMSVGA